ncbi:DUF6438 domain-containing protein [Stenotrophomonas sp. HITSZ_GD]|uniref:DUF6438 domain-containing protein n=1 Tax=Stenotrophomonas sp. HITSZ_GD TaxID=3037248 RepID=UPI00240E66FA|nr:DUF6438 domain-containing protein [Stenotrophomonas sp. HITSZ_GD]MDG2525568.1 DUF6438 domain-containing protein [Stenotrophomonas sp. HITSZ_GD]
MTRFPLAMASLLLALTACTRPPATLVAQPASVRVCMPADATQIAPSPEATAAHLQSEVPAIRLPFGTEREHTWHSQLSVHVDTRGNVSCYVDEDQYGHALQLDADERQALAQARFAPFEHEGTPANAWVRIDLRREESPQRHRPLPEVPLDQVVMTLSRSGCYGTCPSYRVTVRGDGRVEYEGGRFTDVAQKVAYRIPVERVARLVEQVRKADLWSLRETYRAPITDNPSYQLRLQFGNEAHCIVDYAGEWVGMPRSVSDFEDELDRVSGARGLVSLDMEGVQRLHDGGFDFASPQGAAILQRASANDDVQDEVVVALLRAGAPVEGAPKERPSFFAAPPLLRSAALKGRASVLPLLFAKGVFDTHGHRDPEKINEAFEVAIISGNLATVEALWTLSGGSARPSLMVWDEYEDEELRRHRKRVPIVLKLSGNHHFGPHPWQGMQIAQWLAQKGNDLKARGADGRTLLSVAAEADDVAFVRFLLAQGLNPAASGQYGTPLGATQDDDVAVALLEAGAPLSDWKDRKEFRDYAWEHHWPRVLAWLDAHPEKMTSGS